VNTFTNVVVRQAVEVNVLLGKISNSFIVKPNMLGFEISFGFILKTEIGFFGFRTSLVDTNFLTREILKSDQLLLSFGRINLTVRYHYIKIV